MLAALLGAAGMLGVALGDGSTVGVCHHCGLCLGGPSGGTWECHRFSGWWLRWGPVVFALLMVIAAGCRLARGTVGFQLLMVDMFFSFFKKELERSESK